MSQIANEAYAKDSKEAVKLEEQLDHQTQVRYPAFFWAKHFHKNTRREDMGFKHLHYLLELYKVIGKTPHMCVIKSVQCGVSELFIIQSHIEAGDYGMTVMYVLPKYELRNRFVNNRIYKLHKLPRYEYLVKMSATTVHRTSLMHFGRGTLAYVGSNVSDEFVEISVDSAYVDERDRCNQANLLMLPDRYSASPYGFHRETGNPTIEGYGIDERYQGSSKGVWMLKCPGCGERFTPDFWKHAVRQTGHNQYEVRDPDYESGGWLDARLVHDCGSPVDRLQEGKWVHEFPKKMWKGYRISKLFSKFTRLSDLIEKYGKSLGNDTKMQIFYNSDLGLPFTSKGAKITQEMLLGCCRNYKWPVKRVEVESIRALGVDVGDVLHAVLREKVDKSTWRLLEARTFQEFDGLARFINSWKPKRVVVDAMPESHGVSKLKNQFHFLWAARFQDKVMEPNPIKHSREVRMDRTTILDYVRAGFDDQELLLPREAPFIDDGNYFENLKASTRILEQDEDDIDKARFVWRHTRPDHYFLAEAYCMMAAMIMAKYDIFEHYSEGAKIMRDRVVRQTIKSGDTVEEKKRIDDLKQLTPEVFMGRIQDNYAKPKAVQPVVDDIEIWATCEDMLRDQNYVDIFTVVKLTGENEGDVLRVAKKHRLRESKIKGQYIR